MNTTATRRLAAILAADVVGYSRLMGADEEGTHERLKAHLREVVDPKIRDPSRADRHLRRGRCLAETPAERLRFSGGRDSETGSGCAVPCGAPPNARVQGGTESSNLLCS